MKSVALVFEKALGFDFFNYGKQMIRPPGALKDKNV